MSKHTPGPWKIFGDTIVESAHNLKRICKITEANEVLSDEEIANARLIAAAPEMLEMLEQVNFDLIRTRVRMAGSEHWQVFENIDKIRVIIAKAKGEV